MGNKKERRFPKSLVGNALAEESDRGCVLVGYAYIEFHLELLLRVHFNQNCPLHSVKQAEQFEAIRDHSLNSGMDSLLGSGSARATLALLLGLIDIHAYQLIMAIKELRIECAHAFDAVPLDKDTMQGITELLSKDELDETEYWLREAKDGAGFFGPKEEAGEFSEWRLRFMHACVIVDGTIHQRALDINTDPNKANGIGVIAWPGYTPATIARLLQQETPPVEPLAAVDPKSPEGHRE